MAQSVNLVRTEKRKMSFQRSKIISVASDVIGRVGMANNCYFLVVGHGRSGKDTVASILAERFKFAGGSSSVVIPIMAELLGVSVEVAYETRHEYRQLWYETINTLRDIDPLFIPKLVLQESEMVVGTRSLIELTETVKTFRPTIAIWVDRDVPPDPTLEFDWPMLRLICNLNRVQPFFVDNNGTLDDLRETITTIACNV